MIPEGAIENANPMRKQLMAGRSALGALLKQAVDQRASDLFLLANRDETTIAIRRWGLVEKLKSIPPDSGRHLVNVVKNCAGIDLVERRRPLDGRIEFELEGRPFDVRVNTLPTLFGEDATLRLLDPHQQVRSLEDLGLSRGERQRILGLLERPSGLVLVTGPTGAGKTTTLYACLSHLNDGVRKINTIEDPIEYCVDGIRQSQVNRSIGLDFSQLLGSVLRQAPDVVMIGEVRDAETAETAVRAANSGHLVFATLHAPVAVGAVESMLALGASPHFLASSLVGVIAQRLVRRLCPRCRVPFDMPEAAGMFDDAKPLLDDETSNVLHDARGCNDCEGVGYVGRCGVFEIAAAGARLRQQIADQRPRDELQRTAIDEGMISFRQASLAALCEGRTSLEEVMRVVPAPVLGADS